VPVPIVVRPWGMLYPMRAVVTAGIRSHATRAEVDGYADE